MSLSFKHLLNTQQLNNIDIEKIITLSHQYKADFTAGKRAWNTHSSFILSTLFFEPSTRTRFSFESAMLRLGGKVISLENGASSSLTKGESLQDTARVISGYADITVIRHPDKGSSDIFAEYSSIPVINGGDGSNQHPSQSLADLFTIKYSCETLDNLTIGIVGDLKHSRTVYSLLYLLSGYTNNTFILTSHPLCRLSIEKINILKSRGGNIIETEELNLTNIDALYVVRVQKERFTNHDEYHSVKNKYVITKEMCENSKAIILHALPRINEIHSSVDSLPQALYFTQAHNAVFVRMALLTLLL
ncbi:MAG: aspartate carbamoyltransferase catalytic subunit [Candidatus Deianiraeaceae bacterium]|jgi:aspartate carbamoyltransferase catalytic subunit